MENVTRIGKISEKKKKLMEFMDDIVPDRDKWIKKNRYYYKDLLKLLKFIIPEGSDVLEIGCGTGHILNNVNPKKGVGIDLSSKMVEIAKKQYSN